MSEERLSQLEKEVSVMQATVNPLIQKIEESTNAMTNLANEISLLVQSNDYMQKSVDKIELSVKKNTDDIITLNQEAAVKKSEGEVFVWVKRTIVTAITLALVGLIIKNGI